MTELLSLSLEELQAFVKSRGLSAFRARQIYDWLLRGEDFPGMTNLSESARALLAAASSARSVEIFSTVRSKLDDTEKLIYRLSDGNLIEGVLMRYRHGDTLCVSTQVGCRMGCAFCASTLGGLVRNLTPGEMLGQIIAVNRMLGPEGRRVHNVVLMGSGEPLDNYENVVKFLRLATDGRGLNLSARGISLSTCGLVPEIRRLAEEGIPVTLSVSLHAPDDETRKKLMPVANAYAIGDILAACRYYIEKTGRRVIFEYALAGGVNCETRHADRLAQILRGMQCHVNLIPLNHVAESALLPPPDGATEAFLARLTQRHISATRRREMGDDIEGACGQLRRRVMEEVKPS
jgi:23S rRNA (adenine2503-C2)-methyltransferase